MALIELQTFATNLDDELAEEVRPATTDSLAILMSAIAQCRAELADLYKRLEADLITSAGEKRFLVDGLGEVSVHKKTTRRNWANDDLTRTLVALALDERRLDETTGEYEPAWEAVARVLAECARPTWRVTPLRARGIQVDEYCEESDDGWAVQLPPRQT